MTTSSMPFTDLEQVYDRLAQAIDSAGKNNESVMLTKLCLMLAHQVGDLQRVERAIDAAFTQTHAVSTPGGLP